MRLPPKWNIDKRKKTSDLVLKSSIISNSIEDELTKDTGISLWSENKGGKSRECGILDTIGSECFKKEVSHDADT